MANNIALFKKYIDLLDEVYKVSSLTSKLDSDSTLAKQGANANEIIIPMIDMDGLADYSRNSGYIRGNVTLRNETVTFNYDRGRKFDVDNMDNEESAGLAFGKLSSEFLRTKVVPEMDAFRFATYAGLSNISKVGQDFSEGDPIRIIQALRNAINKMDEDEVPTEDRNLFITPTLLGLIEDMDTYRSKATINSFASVTKVPQSRFYTAIELMDGTSENELEGGFKKAAKGSEINFMILRRDALLQYPKHTVSKIISPEVNQDKDAWMFFYRAYGLADAYENKRAGIYLNYFAENTSAESGNS